MAASYFNKPGWMTAVVTASFLHIDQAMAEQVVERPRSAPDILLNCSYTDGINEEIGIWPTEQICLFATLSVTCDVSASIVRITGSMHGDVRFRIEINRMTGALSLRHAYNPALNRAAQCTRITPGSQKF